MKRKWKWLILLMMPLVILATCLWTGSGRSIPVDVVGEISSTGVEEILAVVKSKLRPELFHHFSWQNVRKLPGQMRRYSKIKLFTVSKVNPSESWVYVWSNTNGIKTKVEFLGRLVVSGHGMPFAKMVNTNDLFLSLQEGTNGWDVMTIGNW